MQMELRLINIHNDRKKARSVILRHDDILEGNRTAFPLLPHQDKKRNPYGNHQLHRGIIRSPGNLCAENFTEKDQCGLMRIILRKGNGKASFIHHAFHFFHGLRTIGKIFIEDTDRPAGQIVIQHIFRDFRESKIQAEKALAEEDALQAQPPDTEPADVLREDVPEQPIPTLRELHERYKPIVLEAVTQDIRYRNACGHSDYENAMIECNAAVRRAILDSHDIELIPLFSDVPEFRQRLHREVADETYPKLHELLRPLSDNDIDRAIQDWNGKIESKHAVVRYMKDHAREKDTAAWLAREFDGGDGKTPFAVRPESPEGTALPWPKVQRRIVQLIKEDRFYTEAEQDRFDNIDSIAIREALAERGIVNGQVVDPEKLDSDPFIRQVMRDVEAVATEEQAEAAAKPPVPDLSGQPVTREGDTLTIGSGEPTHEIDITVSDEEYAAIRGTIPERTAYDPSAPVYNVGNTVYLDDRAHQITELREDTVQLLPTGMSYPIYRVESRERFEQLLSLIHI